MKSKIPLQAAAEILGELLAIYLAIRIGNISGVASGAIVFLTGSWLFYKVSSYERLWSLLAMLKDPAKSFMVHFSLGTIYFGLKAFPAGKLLLASLGTGLLGSALALVLDGYWEIGG